MTTLSAKFSTLEGTSQKYIEVSDDLQTMFKRDYDEFIRDRRRWKTDFDVAIKKSQNNHDSTKEILENCLEQNRINCTAVK